MAGRVRGVVLLAVALLAVSVGFGLHGHVLPGLAVVVPPPDPPAVGACLTATPPGTTWGYQFDGSDPLITYRPDYPAADFAPCAGARYGEVVDVVAEPAAVTIRRTATRMQISDPTGERCSQSLSAYLGTAASVLPEYFVPAASAVVSLLGPTDRQRAAGQHWAACVLTATGHNGSPAQFPGSARGLFATGDDRDQLGACQVLTQWANGPEDGACAVRHRSEIFANVSVPAAGATTRTALEADCRRYVQAVTGLPDVTGGGKLQVSLRIFADGSSLDIGRNPDPQTQIVCGIETVGAFALTHSLIAWGDQALPLV